MARLLFAAVLVLLVTVPAVTAEPRFTFKSTTIEHSGWVSFSIPNTSAGTLIGAVAPLGPASASGVHLFESDGTAIGVVFGERSSNGNRVLVVDEITGHQLRPIDDDGEAGSFSVGAGANYTAASPRLFVAIWTAGPHVEWWFEIKSPTPFQIEDFREGSSAYYHTDVDHAGTSAQAQIGAVVIGAGALTHKTIDVTGRLLGAFASHGLGATGGLSTVAGPQGLRVCPCIFDDAIGDDALTPGTYEFAWTGAAASLGGAHLYAADVEIAGLTD